MQKISGKNSYIRKTLELLRFVTVCDKTIMKFVKMADQDVARVPQSTLQAVYMDYLHSNFHISTRFLCLNKSSLKSKL